MYTVSGAFLSAIADWLAETGLASTPVYHKLKRMQPEHKVSLGEVSRLFDEVVRVAGDPLAPLKAGQCVRWRHLGALGHILVTSRTMEELLYGYVAYEKLFYGSNVASVVRDESRLELYWPSIGIPEPVALFTMSSFATIATLLSGRERVVAGVGFPFDDRANAEEYKNILRCPVQFSDEYLHIRFATSELYKAISAEEVFVKRSLSAEECIPEIDDALFRKHLFEEVISAIPRRSAQLNRIAINLGLSTRTLQRRLEMVPDGLRGLVSRIRMRKAEDYLKEKNLPLSSIALLLGYSEQSAFNLAFRKHSEKTPTQFRIEAE